MQNCFKLTLQYDGTDLFGFQIQPQGRTVQGELEKALRKIVQRRVRVTPAGRTDSGVHAGGQVAHVAVPIQISAEVLRRALNAYLPHDIAVLRCQSVPAGFHARKDAKWKLYRYTVLNHPIRSPLYRRTALFVPQRLNLSAIRRASRFLVGEHDFRSFQAKDKVARSSRRRIRRLTVNRRGDLVTFDIEGNGFVYRMVRNVVGTLILVGKGKIDPSDLRRIRNARHRARAGPTAPAHGLCLVRVSY